MHSSKSAKQQYIITNWQQILQAFFSNIGSHGSKDGNVKAIVRTRYEATSIYPFPSKILLIEKPCIGKQSLSIYKDQKLNLERKTSKIMILVDAVRP